MKSLFIKTGFLCLGLGMMASGCKKFLDQPVQGTLPEQDFYKTDAEINQGTVAIYDMMQAHYNNNWASPYLVKTLLSDESNAGGSNDGDQPGYQQLDDYNFSANNDKVRDAWRLLYYSIYRSNKVIGRTEANNPLRRRLVAEAKALRAYNYLELTSLWGDVPLVLGDLVPSEFTTTPRTAQAQVYAQIEKDLNEAIPELPLKSAYSASDRFRISKGAAQAILGKALLYQKKYSDAATAFETVITSGQYNLEPTIGKVFSQAGEFGAESLFEINYTNMQNYDWGNFPWGAAPESNIHIQLMGPRADFYTKAPGDSLLGGWGFNLPRQKLWDAFQAAGDVNRRRATMMSDQELIAAGGNWTSPTAWDYQGYFQRKYGSFQSQTGAPVGELNYGTNWRLIRYADVLLMAAEANLNGGSAPKALTYINLVRQRSGTNLPALGTVTMNDIMTERFLELAFEGHRFQDLVRWGKASQELGPLGFVTGKHEHLPIPQFDVQSGNLSQNNGY
ncbi:RagB/SusD family nutrient uptake outer membrane protein [Flaviaesturariibacter aridisoli]|uniref:RagB/SusD family nutrient uptake outer membrane protein n=1 Tax=Flaviaesturariibacter aridisoli TaxID=2545761 RepID=A0A4R4E2H4_9BACT|nr:RagB/SusD family nutrient uptake outer membrane protein [Flaviaesturariibacter aridisoli]TCZ72973.1 RagB/SusD family nutrient uptake outer membrane protein [Flaviaesturariibacter aridisoli]